MFLDFLKSLDYVNWKQILLNQLSCIPTKDFLTLRREIVEFNLREIKNIKLIQDLFFLKDLKNWVSDKTLNKTCTYAFLDGDESKTFCYDIQEGTQGHYLLITWNKVSSFSNGVATVSGTSKVGEADIKTNNHNVDDIPGVLSRYTTLQNELR